MRLKEHQDAWKQPHYEWFAEILWVALLVLVLAGTPHNTP